MTVRILIATFLLMAAGICRAESSRLPAIDTYIATLSAVERAQEPVSLEPLLKAAEETQDALMNLVDGSDKAWLESLSANDYAALKRELRGLKLSRGYDTYAQPNGRYFLKLAKAHGRPEDREFFRLYSGFWSHEQLPQYLRLGKSPTPCVRFDEGILPDLYANWSHYAAAYPAAYAGFTQQTLRDLEEVLVLGVCACGDERSVQNELKGFVARFPNIAVAAQIRARLQELEENRNLHPVHCR
jgi:hypothetical protein